MTTLIESVKKHFNGVLFDENSVKMVSIYSLGYLCIMKTKLGFLIGISYESGENTFGASVDFDESKFESNPKYLGIQLDSKEMFAKQRKFLRKKLGFFHFIKRDFPIFVEANIEFFGDYFKNNHQLILSQFQNAKGK